MDVQDSPTPRTGVEFDHYLQPSEKLLQVDVECLMCGQLCGVIEAPQDAPNQAVFIPLNTGVPETVVVSGIHCVRCGGNVLVGEQRIIRRYADQINWEFDRPRRGRPPRWLTVRREEDGLRRATAASRAHAPRSHAVPGSGA